MALVQIDRDPDRATLNRFGFVWLGFLTLFALLAWWRFDAPSVAGVLAVLAVCVPVTGWIVPRIMRWVYVGMSFIAFPVGYVVGHVVLALVYYGLITPIGLTMRLVGYDPLHRAFDRDRRSYWAERERGGDVSRYFRQF